MIALYNLGEMVAGFDFFNWLVQVKALGATEVVFDIRNPKTSKWDYQTVMRRFESILLPGPALAGLSCRIGTEGERMASPLTRDFVKALEGGMVIERLKSVLPVGSEKYTVTLRDTQRAPNRNSLTDDWRTFADEIGARVIEEYDVEPLGLHERVSLYAGAEMNFFVTNGPAGMCSLTPYPMMMFDCNIAMGPAGRYGIPFGVPRYPWMLEGQSLIWEAATLPTIRKHFEALH